MKKTRRATIIGMLFFVLSFLWAVFPMNANAHPPASVELTYYQDKQILEVKITHVSSSPDKHYVKKVVIKKNGEVAGGGDYTSQPDKEVFTYAYKLSVAPGDLLEVGAQCSIFGSKLVEWKVQ
jgi:hypothetical protein